MKYTKKQITEAIAHWQKVLESLDESSTILPGTTLFSTNFEDIDINPEYEDSSLLDGPNTEEISLSRTSLEDIIDKKGEGNYLLMGSDGEMIVCKDVNEVKAACDRCELAYKNYLKKFN